MPGAAASAAFCQDTPTFVTIIIAARHARRTTMPAFVGASNLSVTRGSAISHEQRQSGRSACFTNRHPPPLSCLAQAVGFCCTRHDRHYTERKPVVTEARHIHASICTYLKPDHARATGHHAACRSGRFRARPQSLRARAVHPVPQHRWQRRQEGRGSRPAS